MGFHIQRTIPNWLEAVQRLPGGALVKAVDQGQIFREVKNINANINTCLRHWYDQGQVFGGSYAENKQRARDFFSTFVDGTFISEIAPYCDYIEEWNEYLANSQNQAEIADRKRWAEAAADVWLYEYRSRPELAHIRLVLCNTAIGNDIAVGFFRIARDYDALLGYHSYTYYRHGQRGVDDWRYLSGRWHFMEQQYGVPVDWIFTEAGPYESAVDGWRSPNCLNNDVNAYIEAVRQWIRDVAQTPAYAEGRVKGFALFTTGGGDQWSSFETGQPEMNLLADMITQEWRPGTASEDDEDDDDPIPDGLNHKVTINLVPQNVTDPEYECTRKKTKAFKESILQSADDTAYVVAAGLPGSKVKVWAPGRWTDDIGQWLIDRGVVLIEYLEYPEDGSENSTMLAWPLPDRPVQTHFEDWAVFNAPRDYNDDGIKESLHEGIDIHCTRGDRVVAGKDGVVVWASDRRRSVDRLSRYGKHIVIDHSDGLFTWYCHLDDMLSGVGDVVEAGDGIGAAGNSTLPGLVMGVHLHFVAQIIGQGLSGYVVSDVVNPAPLLGV
jgi:murein DD-endopeptidase MepM/ murein hydrolase activator NlpD